MKNLVIVYAHPPKCFTFQPLCSYSLTLGSHLMREALALVITRLFSRFALHRKFHALFSVPMCFSSVFPRRTTHVSTPSLLPSLTPRLAIAQVRARVCLCCFETLFYTEKRTRQRSWLRRGFNRGSATSSIAQHALMTGKLGRVGSMGIKSAYVSAPVRTPVEVMCCQSVSAADRMLVPADSSVCSHRHAKTHMPMRRPPATNTTVTWCSVR